MVEVATGGKASSHDLTTLEGVKAEVEDLGGFMMVAHRLQDPSEHTSSPEEIKLTRRSEALRDAIADLVPNPDDLQGRIIAGLAGALDLVVRNRLSINATEGVALDEQTREGLQRDTEKDVRAHITGSLGDEATSLRSNGELRDSTRAQNFAARVDRTEDALMWLVGAGLLTDNQYVSLLSDLLDAQPESREIRARAFLAQAQEGSIFNLSATLKKFGGFVEASFGKNSSASDELRELVTHTLEQGAAHFRREAESGELFASQERLMAFREYARVTRDVDIISEPIWRDMNFAVEQGAAHFRRQAESGELFASLPAFELFETFGKEIRIRTEYELNSSATTTDIGEAIAQVRKYYAPVEQRLKEIMARDPKAPDPKLPEESEGLLKPGLAEGNNVLRFHVKAMAQYGLDSSFIAPQTHGVIGRDEVKSHDVANMAVDRARWKAEYDARKAANEQAEGARKEGDTSEPVSHADDVRARCAEIEAAQREMLARFATGRREVD